MEDVPEGCVWFKHYVKVDGDIVEQILVEIWKVGSKWKWVITKMSDGEGPAGIASSRDEAIKQACEALEKIEKEIRDVEMALMWGKGRWPRRASSAGLGKGRGLARPLPTSTSL